MGIIEGSQLHEAGLWVSISWRDAVTHGNGQHGVVLVSLDEFFHAMEVWQRDSFALLLTSEGKLRKAGTPETTVLHLTGANARFKSASIGKALSAYIDEEAPKVLEVLRDINANLKDYAKKDASVWELLGWGKQADDDPPEIIRGTQLALDAAKVSLK